jgi:hypothetical protein
MIGPRCRGSAPSENTAPARRRISMSLDRHIVESLRRTVAALREIEELVDQLSPDLDAGDVLGEAADSIEELISPDAVAWREFIDEHPELTAETRLEVTDEDVLDAVVEIHAGDLTQSDNWPEAWDVRRRLLRRQQLDHRPPTHSDLMRVVAALKRLEKAGRVVQVPRYVYGQRRCSEWHPAAREGRDDA